MEEIVLFIWLIGMIPTICFLIYNHGYNDHDNDFETIGSYIMVTMFWPLVSALILFSVYIGVVLSEVYMSVGPNINKVVSHIFRTIFYPFFVLYKLGKKHAKENSK